MRHSAESSAIRILSGDGTVLAPSPPPPPATRGKWFVPLAVVAGVFAVFAVATRPAPPDPTAPATTLPAPIAAIDAEPINLIAPQPSSNLSAELTTATIEPARLGEGLLHMSSSYVAVGSNGEGAQVWLSGNGTSWREATTLELPDSAKSSIDHAVHFDGRVVALGSVDDGTGVWTASTPSTWVYHGPIESMGRRRIASVAAGTELLAIGGATPVEGWMSSDGRDWRWLGSLHDLDDVDVYTLAANEAWYFAGGSRCDGTSCYPAIYRSADGTVWEPTTMPALPAEGPGIVADITTTATGLLAVGSIGAPPQTEAAVWRSSDGSAWERVGADSPAFAASSVIVDLLDARGGENPVATISTNGIEHTVTNGTELVTDGGLLSIQEISDSSIELGIPTSRRLVSLATPTEIVSFPTFSQVATEGPRIVIGGAMAGELSWSPAIWTSSDSGATWTRTVSPSVFGEVSDVALAGANVVAAGYSAETSSGTTIWHARWATDTVGDTAVRAVQAYMAALDQKEADTLEDLLPAVAPRPFDRRFEIPSVAGMANGWWDPDSGDLDPTLLSATLDYLRETDLSIELGPCAKSVTLGATDRVKVSCEYTVNSTLMTVFGLDDATGRVRASVSNGNLENVLAEPAPSQQMWATLENVIAQDGLDDPVPARQPIGGATQLDGASARGHIAVAERYVAGLLKPGDTKKAKTSLGTIEWTWIEQAEMDVDAMGAVVWTDLGFVAVGHGNPSGSNVQVTLWSSPDGRDWSPLPVPEDVDSLWNLHPFNGGLVGQTWFDDRAGLAVFDGATWIEIELPIAESSDYLNLHNMAISGDRIVAITGSWSENGEQIVQAHAIGTDFIPKTVALPAEIAIDEVSVELAGSDEGFILATSSYGSDVSLSVWHSVDGSDWTLLTQSEPLEDAQYAWNLQRHRSQYFVVGDGSEMRCVTTSQGENCVSLAQLWSSPDGAAWSRVRTDGGEPVSTYDVGSGPLGLVAVSQRMFDGTFPRSVYTSVDGASWELTSDFALLHPSATWWWMNTPAVSEDTIVMVGAAVWDTGELRDQPFVIIGRVIGP